MPLKYKDTTNREDMHECRKIPENNKLKVTESWDIFH